MVHESEQRYPLARRKSYRCSIGDAEFDSELRVDQQRYPVAVVDESSGGFGVIVEGPLPLKPGDSALLRHRSGWSEVRVAHISPEESAPQQSAAAGSAGAGQFAPQRMRVGLQRLRDLEMPDGSQRAPWAVFGDLRAQMMWLVGSTVRSAVAGVVFAVLVVGIPAMVLGTLVVGGHSALIRLLPESRWNERLAESAGRAGARPARPFSPLLAGAANKGLQTAQTASAEQGASSPPAGAPAPPAAAAASRPRVSPTELVPESMRETIRRLPGAAPFEVPAVARYLELTPAQQAQIANIIEQTLVAIRQMETQLRGASRQAMARYEAVLFDHARQQAEAVLDQAQRARWRELCGTASPDPL